MIGKLLKGETLMKLKTALNKIKKHLKGEDYVLEKNYRDQGISGDLVTVREFRRERNWVVERRLGCEP